MRAKRIDANQKQIVKQLRQLPGVSVKITSMVGDGFVDAVIGYRGRNYLAEIKDPSQPPNKRKLTPDEQRFHKDWKGQVAIIECLDDALKMIQQ